MKKNSAVEKKVFIKGQQRTLNGILPLIINIVLLEKYWVMMEMGQEKTCSCIFQLLIDIVDTL